jgi:hypothetical protein
MNPSDILDYMREYITYIDETNNNLKTKIQLEYDIPLPIVNERPYFIVKNRSKNKSKIRWNFVVFENKIVNNNEVLTPRRITLNDKRLERVFDMFNEVYRFPDIKKNLN